MKKILQVLILCLPLIMIKVVLQLKQIKSVLNGKTIDLTGESTIIKSTNFNVDKNGNMTCKNANVTGTINSSSGKIGAFKIINDNLSSQSGDGAYISLSKDSIYFGKRQGSSEYPLGQIGIYDTNSYIDFLRTDGNRSKVVANEMTAESFNPLSLESLKTNIKKYEDNAIELIKNNNVYQYNFKTEKDKTKKHIGFIIPDNGGDYKIPNEIISQSGKAIDTYSMASILWKAVQEQQEQIEQMKKEIKKLKGGK